MKWIGYNKTKWEGVCTDNEDYNLFPVNSNNESVQFWFLVTLFMAWLFSSFVGNAIIVIKPL